METGATSMPTSGVRKRTAIITRALSADLFEAAAVELRKRLEAHVEHDLADPQVRVLQQGSSSRRANPARRSLGIG